MGITHVVKASGHAITTHRIIKQYMRQIVGKKEKGKKDERSDKSGPSLHNYHTFHTFGGRTFREIFFGVQKI